jgi:RAQPRD family integrative conjugative element protein
MKRQFWASTFLILGLCVAPAAFADADAEREALAKIIHELNAHETLINRAEVNADRDSRIRFRYDWLRQDLKQIKDGIKLRCDPDKSGKMAKIFSTTDHFSGVRLTHRLIGNQIEITVLRSQIKNRRVEIHGLAKNECKNLAPIVTTVTESYTFPARTGLSETRSFGDTMSFKYTITSAGKNRVLID